MGTQRLLDEALVFYNKGRYAEAIAPYREALRLLTPEAEAGSQVTVFALTTARLGLANCALRTGQDLEEAVAVCGDHLAVEPANVQALFRRGVLRRDLAKTAPSDGAISLLRLAREDLEAAAKLEPKNTRVSAALGQVDNLLQSAALDPQAARNVIEVGNPRETALSADGPRADVNPNDIEVAVVRSAQSDLTSTTLSRGNGVATASGASPYIGGAQAWLAQRDAWRRAARTDVIERRAAEPDEEDLECIRDALTCEVRPYPELSRSLPLEAAVHCALELWPPPKRASRQSSMGPQAAGCQDESDWWVGCIG